MSDDPRDASLEKQLTFPRAWSETHDFISAFSMVLAGGAMITRNRSMAWPALGVAISAWINQHPLRTKEGGQGLGPVLFAFGSLAAAYLPTMILQNAPALQTPLDIPGAL